MFDCPNCGEPVGKDSPYCPHCGSDAETGWSPDVDYYSLDLPGDDEFDVDAEPTYPEDAAIRVRNLIGPAAIVLCFVLFVSAGYREYDLGIIVPSLFLMGMTLVLLRGQPQPRH